MAESMEDYFCVNCEIYGWPQVSDRSRLLRCSRCKFISYCSKECQEEHWVKVHSQHCKYMSKQKECPMTMHHPVSCPGCTKQAEVGLLEMSKMDNPCLGCPWNFSFDPHVTKPDYKNVGQMLSVPLPFKLGEISGKFLTKVEHTVSILQHLVHKLKLTKHPAWTILPASSDQLDKLLIRMRMIVWVTCVGDISKRLEVDIPMSIQPVLKMMLDIGIDIDMKLLAAKFRDLSIFRVWDTFKLFLNILLQQFKDIARRDAVRIGVPEMYKDDLKFIVNPDQFNDMWKRVLNSMDGGLVPFTDLLKIVSGGDIRQECFGCSKVLIVADLHCIVTRVPFLYQSFVQASLCGDPDCSKQLDALDAKVYEICSKISCAAIENTCDNCFLVSRSSVHRCTKCLTKYYCGVECRDEDWDKVHKLVCKEDQVRKIKWGKQDRNLKGLEKVEEFVKECAELE